MTKKTFNPQIFNNHKIKSISKALVAFINIKKHQKNIIRGIFGEN